jgi:hypothetical protein
MDQFTNSIYSSDYALRLANNQIAQLTAENDRLLRVVELREKERDQSILVGGIQVIDRGHIVSCTNHIYNKDAVENINELYMHLTHLKREDGNG